MNILANPKILQSTVTRSTSFYLAAATCRTPTVRAIGIAIAAKLQGAGPAQKQPLM